ncbi:MAG: sugar phosphate isomerase/epimerase family protein [Elusimicrobiota bacterium]|nr:sugar phosphate isomerase/epimerase family protein [Elusimicrobiota bacterium]
MLEQIATAKFKYVEVWCGSEKYGKHNHFNFDSADEIDTLRKLISKFDLNVLSVHGPFSDIVDLSIADEEKRNFAVKLTIKSAVVLKILGGNTLVVHPGSTPYASKNDSDRKKEEEIRFQQSKKSLSEINNFAINKDIKLAIENQLPHIFGSQPETLFRLIEEIDPANIGICFDSSHSTFFQDKSVYDMLEKLSSKIVTTHISDSNAKSDEHFIPGEGIIDWKRIMTILKQKNFTGPFILEIIKLPEGKSLVEVIKYLYEFSTELLNSV